MTSEMENRTGAVKKSQTNVEKQYDGSHWVAKMTRPGPGVHLINMHSSVFMAEISKITYYKCITIFYSLNSVVYYIRP